MNKKSGFTLAEVLITLAIIGVVATMTIPTLIAKINTIVATNQTKVFKAKLLKGLNLTRTNGEMNNTYSSTEDFLRNGLGKHLKITKICGPTEIRNCVPYDSILYTTSDNKEDSVDVKDIDTATELNLSEDDGYRDIASFVMGDGTVVIASYKLDCLVDEGKLDRDIGENPCFAGIYDINGSRKPNKMGKDLQTFQTASLNIQKGPAVLATVGGVKIITAAQVPTPLDISEYCDTSDSNPENWTVKYEYSKYGITKCCTYCFTRGYQDQDYWAGAAKTCANAGGKLPTEQQLADIASELYEANIGPTESYYGSINTSKIPSVLGLDSLSDEWYILWSNAESQYNGTFAFGRNFEKSATTRADDDYIWRASGIGKFVCVID